MKHSLFFIVIFLFSLLPACNAKEVSPELVSAAMTQTAVSTAHSKNPTASQIRTTDTQTSEEAQGEYGPSIEARVQTAVSLAVVSAIAAEKPTTEAFIKTSVAEVVSIAQATAEPTIEALIQTAIAKRVPENSIADNTLQPAPSSTAIHQSTKTTGALTSHAEQDGYALDVLEIEDPVRSVDLSSDSLYPRLVGYKYIAVKISIENNSGEKMINQDTYGILVDNGGYLYEAKPNYNNLSLHTPELSPGEKSMLWVIFQIPVTATPAKIKYMYDRYLEKYLEAGIPR